MKVCLQARVKILLATLRKLFIRVLTQILHIQIYSLLMFKTPLHSMYYTSFAKMKMKHTHTQNKYDLSKMSESKWRIQVIRVIEKGYNSFKRNFVLLLWFWKENYLHLSLKMASSTDILKENNIYHH